MLKNKTKEFLGGEKSHQSKDFINHTYSIILFDGICNLCNQWVNFVITRDVNNEFRFASLQSEVGRQILFKAGLPTDCLDSIVLVEKGKAYLYSTSILRTMKHLNRLWPVMYILIAVPSALRDRVYKWVASNRYSWFGKQKACLVPTPEIESRFLKE